MKPAPYPSDVQSKGWRFELNTEQVKKSETWLRARTGYVRAHLLLLWTEAWEQSPCGSLPNDDELISLMLDMDPEDFAKHRAVLMRGWWLAEDGRLYHDTIVERVLDMIEKRMSNAERARKSRDKKGKSQAGNTRVTRDAPVTDGYPTCEFDTKNQNQNQNQISPNGDTPPPPALETVTAVDAAGVGFVPTPAGLVCKLLKQAGIASVSPGHQDLITLLEAGATVDEFLAVVPQALKKSNPFTWLLATLIAQRKRAAQDLGEMHKGAMPAAPARLSARGNERLEHDHGGACVDQPM